MTTGIIASGPRLVAILDEHNQKESGTLFVDCIACGERDEIHVPFLNGVSDQQAAAWFRARGWTIKPTRCPKCREQAAEAEAGKEKHGNPRAED